MKSIDCLIRFIFNVSKPDSKESLRLPMITRNFIAAESHITTQGSKVHLIFEEFTDWENLQLDDPEDSKLLTLNIEYPTYGGTGVSTITNTCFKVTSDFDDVNKRTILICEFDQDIHVSDKILTTSISIPAGWLSTGTGQNDERTGAINWDPSTANNPSANQTTVPYPKSIVSWDDVPYQILNSPSKTKFKVRLHAFHRYSYPDSPGGDLDVKIRVVNKDDPTISLGEETATFVGRAASRPGFPRYGVYEAEFDQFDELNSLLRPDGDYLASFEITPSRGDAASKKMSVAYSESNTWDPGSGGGVLPNIEELVVALNGGGTIVPKYVAVDRTNGNDSQTQVFDDEEQAILSPYKTVAQAKLALENASGIQDVIIDGVIVLEADRYMWGLEFSAGLTQSLRWLTIRGAKGTNPDQVILSNSALRFEFDDPQTEVTAFTITNLSDADVEWRWTSETFEIRGAAIGNNDIDRRENSSSQPTTVADLVAALNSIAGLTATATPGRENWFVSDDGGRFFSATEFDDGQIADTASADIEGLDTSYLILRHVGSNIEVEVFKGTATESFQLANSSTVQDLVTQLTGLASINITATALTPTIELSEMLDFNTDALTRNLPSQTQIALNYDPPQDIKHDKIKLESLTIYNTELNAANNTNPAHMWFHNVTFENASSRRIEGASAPPIAPNKVSGGIWATRVTFRNMHKCTSGWCFARDILFENIGGDAGKQVNCAVNWKGKNIESNPYDATHPDYFQWSVAGSFSDVIAMNLDFRDRCFGQPFFFDPTSRSTDFDGVAIINMRSNSVEAQQFQGTFNHLLMWYCSVFQGDVDEERGRMILLEGYSSAGDNDPGLYYNVSIRNSACERMEISGRSGANQMGDIPSLFSILRSNQILRLLVEDPTTNAALTIDDYIGCKKDGTLTNGESDSLFVDFSFIAIWKPRFSGPIARRIGAGDIVVRFDAEGDDRTTPTFTLSTALGAVWERGF